MKRIVLNLILGVFISALIMAGGCAGGGGGKADGLKPVNTAKAAMGLLDGGVTLSGKLEALQSANVVANVPGKVAAVHVDIGSAVKAGQVMITLENASQEAAVAQAEAGLSRAEAELANALSTYEVDQADYLRNKQLFEAGAISGSVFEGIELTYKKSRENAERTAPAALASARAALQSARTAYNDTFIKAPFGGVVTARNINPGEMASSTASVITVVNLDKVVVRATVQEEQVNGLSQDQEVKVKVAAVSPELFTGKVTNIALAADPTSKAFPIKVQIDNAGGLLKPGMFAEVYLGREDREALLIPRQALVRDGDDAAVWVIREGAVVKTPVEPGSSDDKHTVILSGLNQGDEVVTSGQDALTEGAAVKVIN